MTEKPNRARGLVPPLPLALPGQMSASQVQAMLEEVQARRSQARAMRDAMDAFDKQLETLEQGLTRLAEWTSAIAAVEDLWTSPWRTRGPEA
ncbi:MAG: hypothetical protein L0K86_03480 [Actinomycetia bacterium]|nr:hypothetical protein [Actinomycetes bacterium]